VDVLSNEETKVLPFRFHSSDPQFDALQKHVNFWCNLDEFLAPEIKLWIADELNECDEGSPWVRTVTNETFKKHFRHDFPESVIFHFQEEVEKEGAEPVSVSIRVAEVQNCRAEKVVLA
jgi:hypothetical protein